MPARVYIDATFGAGGYATALLEAAACRVVGIDRDPEACRRAEAIVDRYGGRLAVAHGRFGDLPALAATLGLRQVDGIAFDLGVSSPQLDAAERGFSFRSRGPLDMRMDPSDGATAADAVNRLPREELADVLRHVRRRAGVAPHRRGDRSCPGDGADPRYRASWPPSSARSCRAPRTASTRRPGPSRRCGSGSTTSWPSSTAG